MVTWIRDKQPQSRVTRGSGSRRPAGWPSVSESQTAASRQRLWHEAYEARSDLGGRSENYTGRAPPIRPLLWFTHTGHGKCAAAAARLGTGKRGVYVRRRRRSSVMGRTIAPPRRRGGCPRGGGARHGSHEVYPSFTSTTFCFPSRVTVHCPTDPTKLVVRLMVQRPEAPSVSTFAFAVSVGTSASFRNSGVQGQACQAVGS